MMEAPHAQQQLANDIAAELTQLNASTANLERAAAYCELKYNEPSNSSALVFDETKHLTLQSLASVAGQISNIANTLWSSMDCQLDNMNAHDANIRSLAMALAIYREKTARRDIGRLTVERQGLKENTVKCTTPAASETTPRYQRAPIDYTILDDLGHGAAAPEASVLRLPVNRTHSIVSGDSGDYNSSHARLNVAAGAHYEHWMPTQAAYDQGTMRTVKDPYGAPQIGHYYSSYSTLRRNPSLATSHGGGHGALPMGGGGGSGHYGGSMIYGGTRALSVCNRSESSQHAGGYSEEEPLPSPPRGASVAHETQPSKCLYQARALYDYDAAKPDELNLSVGVVVNVVRVNEDGWLEAVLDGVTGLIPANYVTTLM